MPIPRHNRQDPYIAFGQRGMMKWRWVPSPCSRLQWQGIGARVWRCSGILPHLYPECCASWGQTCCGRCARGCCHWSCSSSPHPSGPCWWEAGLLRYPQPILNSGTSERQTPCHLWDRQSKTIQVNMENMTFKHLPSHHSDL